MFEKVNPEHPDKIADRIAGALVDLSYKKDENARIAAEVLLGHGACTIICETSVTITEEEAGDIVARLAPGADLFFTCVPQDPKLAINQEDKIRCGDNGIFKGMPVTEEQRTMSAIARFIYAAYEADGKYILDGDRLIICQSNASGEQLQRVFPKADINPLGDWRGGPDVDAGATNRKLGSDMGDSITGGGLHGKDLSKADVSVNIYAWLKAQRTGMPVEISCAIGDETVDGIPYEKVVNIARRYIETFYGSFEHFAEWGLI